MLDHKRCRLQKDPSQSRDAGVSFYVHDSSHEMYRLNNQWRIADAAESKLMYVGATENGLQCISVP